MITLVTLEVSEYQGICITCIVVSSLKGCTRCETRGKSRVDQMFHTPYFSAVQRFSRGRKKANTNKNFASDACTAFPVQT